MNMPVLDVGDYTAKGFDLRTYYAGFSRRALPPESLARLSWASSFLPPEHIGYKVWMAKTAGRRLFSAELEQWSIDLGRTIAKMKPRIRYRAKTFVPSYSDAWGVTASLDALELVLTGKAPPVSRRVTEFDCDWGAYSRIRSFVAGALLLAERQYEDELLLVHRMEFQS